MEKGMQIMRMVKVPLNNQWPCCHCGWQCVKCMGLQKDCVGVVISAGIFSSSLHIKSSLSPGFNFQRIITHLKMAFDIPPTPFKNFF